MEKVMGPGAGGGVQTLSIINPEELRLPAVKVPDSLDAPSRAAWAQLATLVDTCMVTAADQRPTIECASSLSPTPYPQPPALTTSYSLLPSPRKPSSQYAQPSHRETSGTDALCDAGDAAGSGSVAVFLRLIDGTHALRCIFLGSLIVKIKGCA